MGVIVLEVSAKSYSLSEIATLVEAEGAKIMSSYMTPNQQELSRILASFNRRGFYVKEFYHQSEFIDSMQSRYDSLMNYLGI